MHNIPRQYATYMKRNYACVAFYHISFLLTIALAPQRETEYFSAGWALAW